ncbi:MAG: kelch repeat-containing protein [Pseudomonadota bacterium]
MRCRISCHLVWLTIPAILTSSCTRSGFQHRPVPEVPDAAVTQPHLDASTVTLDAAIGDRTTTDRTTPLDLESLDDTGQVMDTGPFDGADAAAADAVIALDAASEDLRDGARDDANDATVEDAGCPVTHHDGGDGTCVPVGTCALGFHDGGDGSCLPDGTCLSGYHDGGDGACLPDGTCIAGYHDGGDNSCLPDGTCIASYHDGGDGACMPEGTCVAGYHDGGDGSCLPDGACIAGFHDGGGDTCVPVGTCAQSFHDDGCGLCVASGCCPDHVEADPGVCTLAPLDAPTPLDPPDSWPVSTTTPTLRWSWAGSGSAPANFELALSSGPDCSGDVLLVNSLGETWTQVGIDAGLGLGNTVFWCVRASDGVHPTSDWSTPSRLPVRGLRQRLRVGRPSPAVGYSSRFALFGDTVAAALVIPYGADSWGRHDLGYHWIFDLHSERWSLRRTTGSEASIQQASVEDLAVDPVHGDVVAALISGSGGVTGEGTEVRYLAIVDPGNRTWNPLPTQSTGFDAGQPTDGGATNDGSSGSTLASDPEADRVLVARSTLQPRETRMLALERSVSPALLHGLGVDSTLAAIGITEVLHRITGSSSYLHLGLDDKWVPSTALYDAAQERWVATGASTPGNSVIHAFPALDVPLLIGGHMGEFRTWNPLNVQWDAWQPSSRTSFHTPYARTGLWQAPRAAYWTAAGDDVEGGTAGLVLEPDAWPVLTLLDATSGSADGTPVLEVMVRVSGDAEATAWLLSNDELRPEPTDSRWSPTPPTSTTLQGAAGLKRRSLWLRYANGGVGPVPGVASIWYLPDPPPAPEVTVYGVDALGQLQPGLSETGQVSVALEAPLEGIEGFFVSTNPAPPDPQVFPPTLAPVQNIFLQVPPGDVTLYTWVMDAAGQLSQAGQATVFYRDVSPPGMGFGIATKDAVVSAALPQVTWTANDLSLPVTVDLRISSADGDCTGDLFSVDGLTGDSSLFDPDVLTPGRLYTVCIRGQDAWTPPNTSDWVQTHFFFQRTAARWHALAKLPTRVGYSSALAYDSSRGQLLLYGGFYSSNYQSGVHAYDSVANTWMLLPAATDTVPHGRGGAMALYDEARDRLVVTGGFYNPGTQQYPQDTWALDLATLDWTRVTTTGSAPKRTFAPSLHDAAGDRWIVGRYYIWTADSVHDPMAFDLATATWTQVSAFTGYTQGRGSLLPALGATGPLFSTRSALFDFDAAAVTTSPHVAVTGVSDFQDVSAARDDASGHIVQYGSYIGPTAGQTQRTFLLDLDTGQRLRSDAANLADRGMFGLIRDPVRRSVVLVGGYTQHGDPWVETDGVFEFRHHGGPRVFAADPSTGSELEFSGDTVDLAVDWDEGAASWLVNETAWPPPTTLDPGWSASRSTSHVFGDTTPGPRSVFVWIQDGGGAVVEDPGRWDLACLGGGT